MFKSYFVDEKFLGDRSVLLAAAEEAKVPNAAQVLDDKTVRNKEFRIQKAPIRCLARIECTICSHGSVISHFSSLPFILYSSSSSSKLFYLDVQG
jgi:hypothetical protein